MPISYFFIYIIYKIRRLVFSLLTLPVCKHVLTGGPPKQQQET